VALFVLTAMQMSDGKFQGSMLQGQNSSRRWKEYAGKGIIVGTNVVFGPQVATAARGEVG
jgi:hypothetical protein